MLIKKYQKTLLVWQPQINTKINEGKNKIPVVGDIVKKTDYDAIMLEIEGRCTTNSGYNKLKSALLILIIINLWSTCLKQR